MVKVLHTNSMSQEIPCGIYLVFAFGLSSVTGTQYTVCHMNYSNDKTKVYESRMDMLFISGYISVSAFKLVDWLPVVHHVLNLNLNLNTALVSWNLPRVYHLQIPLCWPLKGNFLPINFDFTSWRGQPKYNSLVSVGLDHFIWDPPLSTTSPQLAQNLQVTSWVHSINKTNIWFLYVFLLVNVAYM